MFAQKTTETALQASQEREAETLRKLVKIIVLMLSNCFQADTTTSSEQLSTDIQQQKQQIEAEIGRLKAWEQQLRQRDLDLMVEQFCLCF